MSTARGAVQVAHRTVGRVADRAAPRPQRSGLRLLLRSRPVVLGLVVCLPMGMVAVLAPSIAPYDPMVINAKERLLPPSLGHLMGTDNLGRDILSRVLYGARVSYEVGTASTLLSLLVGVSLGALSGYFGGIVEGIVMRLMDAIVAFPGILLGLTLVTILGSGLVAVITATGVLLVPIFARTVRSLVLTEREKLYVEAARCLGAREVLILSRHIMPNAISPIVVLGTSSFAIAVLIEASLSFLGLGVVPPDVSWGTMLSESRQYMERYPWAPFFPAITITLAVLGLNLLGDGLRDLLDPRLRPKL